MTEFTPLSSTIGGLLIGLSASLLLYSHGRIAGISGIVSGLLQRNSKEEVLWRGAFVAGLIFTGAICFVLYPQTFSGTVVESPWLLALSGLLVGIGTRIGNGCTSGHGVCGLSRFSLRSLIATLTFITAGVVTVLLGRLL